MLLAGEEFSLGKHLGRKVHDSVEEYSPLFSTKSWHHHLPNTDLRCPSNIILMNNRAGTLTTDFVPTGFYLKKPIKKKQPRIALKT